MDITKIRKKALSKDSGSKPVEKPGENPVQGAATDSAPGPAEDQKSEDIKGQAKAEEKDAPQVQSEGQRPAKEIAAAVVVHDTANNAADGAVIDADMNEDNVGLPAEDDTTDANAEELVELLTFSLSDEEYAFRVSDIEEVIRLQKITLVPTMPVYVLGITSLRGKIIPVIDLKIRLNLQGKSLSTDSPGAVQFAGTVDNPVDNPADERADIPEIGKNKGMEQKIMIISGPKGMIGATIDKVKGVVRLPLSGILQPPGHLDEKELRFIEGIVVVGKRFISIIHSDAAMDIEAD